MDEPTPWHRLFALHWVDFFHGMPVDVEIEKDLSLKQQLLDLVIIRKETPLVLSRRLPDGFEDLAHHNLVTFKSHQDSLDEWTLNELIGHFVNYRKQCSPSLHDLFPEADFQLYAVCVRFPQALAERVELRPVLAGVYEIQHFSRSIRIVVVNELAKEEQNAMLHLFSARTELVKYGTEHYRQHSRDTSSLLYRLLVRYRSEGRIMPDLLQEFVQETIDEILKNLSPKERLRGLTADQRVEGLPAEEFLKAFPAEDRVKGLPAEDRVKGLPADELLKALPPETREALLRWIKEDDSGS